MLNTRHDIELLIDDEPFAITVSKMSKEQLETHAAKFADLPKMAVEHDERAERFKRLRDRYRFHDQLGNAAEALKALDELEALEATKPETYSFAKEVFDMIEESNESRFMMTVSGKDKQRLVAVLKEKRISYEKINGFIDKKIEEAQSGK